ncbi:MAG: hypothetical protein ACYCS8_18800 [Acidithiobacillus sp.]
MTKLTSGINAVNAELSLLVHNLTPATEVAWKTAVSVYQVNAISNLVQGLVGLIIFTFIMLAFRSIYFVKRRIPNESIRDKFERNTGCDTWTLWQKADYLNLETAVAVFSLILGVIALVAFGVSLQLLSVWNWLSLFHPQLYAAHEIMTNVIQNH